MKQLKRRLYLWLQKQLGRETENFEVHGVQVRIPLQADINIRYLLARNRPYEAPEAALIKAHLAQGTNVVELGGCMGVVSAVIRQKIGAQARHIVVEANEELARICQVNAENEAEDGAATVVTAAVDYSGADTVRFASGKNAHVGHLASADEDAFSVPATTLGALAKDLPDGQFALVCDIEGAEIALFENETALMSRIDLIILETHPKVYAEGVKSEATMLAKLQELGLVQVEKIDNVVCLKRAG